jgi:hypothetical protein
MLSQALGEVAWKFPIVLVRDVGDGGFVLVGGLLELMICLD